MGLLKERLLVEKERVNIDGKPHFRLYLWDQESGEIIQVLAPIDPRERKIIKEGIFNAL